MNTIIKIKRIHPDIIIVEIFQIRLGDKNNAIAVVLKSKMYFSVTMYIRLTD